jgi:Tfp pilus assembly protein PilF
VLAANLGDWETATPLLERAAERDPSLAINQVHAGYARGVLAAGDPTHLEPAIAHYRAGVEIDPSYAPHHANLAALLWAAGQREEAVAEMQLAVDWAELSPILQLNLGMYHEEMEDPAAAAAAYTRTLELTNGEPAYFWRSTALRKAAFDEASKPAGYDEGWIALERGDLAEARNLFEAELAQESNSVPAYRGLAAVALVEGDREEAEHHLRVALFIGSTYSPQEYLRAQMDWARLAAAAGNATQAISRAAPLLESFRHQSIRGPGRFGTADYGWYVFYRESLLVDMLPQLTTTGLTDEAGRWMLEVAGWHRQVEERAAAKVLCQEVLDAIPDNADAQECLDALAE